MLVPYLAENYISFTKGIHSLSISGHKFIGTPFPSGIVLTCKTNALNINKNVEYIGSKDSTILGSRNGHAALYLWYAITHRGLLFPQEATQCRNNAEYLNNTLRSLGIPSSLAPLSTSVVLPIPNEEVTTKWQLSTKNSFAHFIVMQNHQQDTLNKFINDVARAH